MLLSLLKKTALILSAALLLNTGTAISQEHNHQHGHETHAQLTLDNGHKWATDDNLKLGMTRIRGALAEVLPAIHSGKATTGQYQALAEKINEQIAFMVENCKLGKEADAMLHLVLADIIAGADAMMSQDGDKARKGAEKIASALENYAAYFDHPGWHGLKHGH